MTKENAIITLPVNMSDAHLIQHNRPVNAVANYLIELVKIKQDRENQRFG